MVSADSIFMQRALELAANGAGLTHPNPMVGCVIVHNGEIIGEGWHQKYGGPHAEVNAIHAVNDKSLLPESTVYVTLEPCSHFGKTPPCADLLVKYGVKKVIICNDDPNALVAGRGISKLQEAGIDVESGFLAEKGSVLNRRFFTFHKKQRPYIILKWAQTADHFIARENYIPAPITGALANCLVHKWRSEEAAIFVGTRTALADNPQLNVRKWSGTDPVRIVIDRSLKLPPNLHLFDKTQPTLVFNYLRDETIHQNLETIRLNSDEDFLNQLLYHLFQRQVQSVLIEGGAMLLNSFIKANLWDEARIFRNSKRFEKGILAPQISRQTLFETISIGEDQLFFHKNTTV